MQKKNVSFAEKCKESSRNTFIKIGHSASGNSMGDDVAKGKAPIAPFSWPALWSYEKTMPRRKNK